MLFICKIGICLPRLIIMVPLSMRSDCRALCIDRRNWFNAEPILRGLGFRPPEAD